MTEPTGSRPWAGVPTVLDATRLFAGDGGAALVVAVNPVYLHSVDRRPYTSHWKDLILTPESMRRDRERYIPASLIIPADTGTFGPFGAVISAPGEMVRPARSSMEYAPRFVAAGARSPNPDPGGVLDDHNEVMIRCGEHVSITGFFVKYFDGEPVDPVGAEIAVANAKHLGVPLFRLPEQIPRNYIDVNDGVIRAVHDGFEYLLHHPRNTGDSDPWRGSYRPSPNYDFTTFPDYDAAAAIVTSMWQQTDEQGLADDLWERYLSDRDRRMVPQISEVDGKDAATVRLDRGYGLDTETIVIYSDATAWRHRTRDDAALGGWEGVENLFEYDSTERAAIARKKSQLGAGTRVPPDEVVAMLAEATAAAERTDSPTDRADALLAEGFYGNALNSQRGVIGTERVFPTGYSSGRPEVPPEPAAASDPLPSAAPPETAKPAQGGGRWRLWGRGGGRGGRPRR